MKSQELLNMQTKTKSIILLVEMENGDVHQVIMTEVQKNAVKAVLQSTGTVQVSSKPLDLEIKQEF